MFTSRKRLATTHLILGGLAPTVLMLAATADAQEPPRDTATLEVIVVTAQKREERLLDVPLAVSAFTSATMEEIGAAQLADFLESAPGVGIVDGQSGTQSIQIRGISSQFGNATVGYYLDEMPFTFLGNTPAVDVRTFDLERVEVLRGPQGTLYGDGSIGGTIRVLTKDPDLSELQTAVDLTTSDTEEGEGSYGIKGMLNVPLKKGVAAMRLVASKEEFGGWVDNTTLNDEDQNSRDVDNYRAKFRIAPSENLDVVLSAWHSESEADESSASLANQTSPLPDQARTGDEYDLYSATLRYSFAAFDLVSATSYMDFTNTLDTTVTIPGFGVFPFTIDTSQDLLASELRLTSNSEGLFRWTAGLFYRDIDRDTFLDLSAFGIIQDLTATSESYAAFGEATWALWDGKVDLTLGLRYFEDDRFFFEPVSPALLALIQTLDPDFTGTSTETYDSTSPRLNLAYHPNEDWLVYTNIAKGFRTGQPVPTASLVFAILNGLTIPTTVEPETLWSYEIGTKGSLAEGRVTLEGAVYYNDWEDLQVLSFVSTAPPFPTLINGGPGRVKGVEFATALLPVDGLTLRFSAAYADAEYSETVPGTSIVAGDRITQVPETTFSASATHRWPLFASLEGFLHGGVQYTSDRTDVVNQSLPSDETTVLDLRFGLEAERWGAYLFVDNATNEDGAVDAAAAFLGGVATRFRPRTYGLNLRYNFN